MIGVIYEIRCLVDNRIYVGSTNKPKKRWASHKSRLKLGRHHSRPLQAAFLEFGEHAFEMHVLSEVACGSLRDVEQQWLDRLRPFGSRGFNRARETVPGSRGCETAVQIASDGHVIGLHESAAAAARALGLSAPDSIYRAAKSGNRRAGGFFWRLGDEYCLGDALTISPRAGPSVARAVARAAILRRRAVRRVSDGRLFPSILSAAAEINVRRTTLCRAIRQRKRCRGEMWIYA
jgi:hypothetical protein